MLPMVTRRMTCPGSCKQLTQNIILRARQVGALSAARDFYEAAYFTAREEDEILTSISFVAKKGGYAYEKQKRKIGELRYRQLAGVLLSMDDGVCSSSIKVALTNLSRHTGLL